MHSAYSFFFSSGNKVDIKFVHKCKVVLGWFDLEIEISIAKL